MSDTSNYQDTFSQLEKMVLLLAKGDLPLEEAFRMYEHSLELMAKCQQVLESYETEIQSLSTPPSVTTTEDQKLEERLSTLDKFASRLEQGSFTLEDAFSQYQESMALVHECTHLLSVYEQEAILLSQQTECVEEAPLHQEEHNNV